MSHMQGYPGPAGAPGPHHPGQGPGTADQGRRLGILALVVVVLVALSFGLAKATGADARDNGASGGQMPDMGGMDDYGDIGDFGGGELDLDGIPDPGDLGDPDDLGLDTGGGDLGGSGGTGGQPPTDNPTPDPTDPTMDLYQQVSAGNCLGNWMVNETDWASTNPEMVDCSADNAGVWVSQTSGSVSDCPVDAGRSYLSYSFNGETVALCVTRQFEIGQCFLGMSDGSGNLMSWVDCQGGTVPSPYSQKFNVIAVYAAPSNPTGNECSSDAGNQQYYWWTMDGDSTLLCAVTYSG
ncbi:hypothetical protein [Streptomyces profundus]|uniref:hypothetical protein n=1 Tax=Streptomyces profundus TaxID=2867410 RepID=UPI001D16C2B4|nr:hypothetical protein [Streptomyces sp. MA3_2.13]UED87367.1 hypothetical protein K4G22_26755 [Streptomyces sp. MA3_2.13]